MKVFCFFILSQALCYPNAPSSCKSNRYFAWCLTSTTHLWILTWIISVSHPSWIFISYTSSIALVHLKGRALRKQSSQNASQTQNALVRRTQQPRICKQGSPGEKKNNLCLYMLCKKSPDTNKRILPNIWKSCYALPGMVCSYVHLRHAKERWIVKCNFNHGLVWLRQISCMQSW